MLQRQLGYGMELDLEVESTIAKLHRADRGFTYKTPGFLQGTYHCFTGGYYVDNQDRRIELMSRWRLSQQLSKIAISSLLRLPRPQPVPRYESVSLTIDDPFRRIGRICFWDFNLGGKSLMDGTMVMDEIDEEYYDLSEIPNSPNPIDRHDYFVPWAWGPGNRELDDHQPNDARKLEQDLVQVVRRGSEIGWQTLWR
jgi:hypothetical protein